MGAEDGAGANDGVFFHHAIGPDRAALADLCGVGDDGGRVDAGREFQWLGTALFLTFPRASESVARR
jgi:hypothetical protein